MAGHAVPVLDGHIGAGRVVVGQHRPHEHEEVADPATDQRFVDWHSRVSRTEAALTDVGMGHVAVALGWLWIERNDVVCVGSAYIRQSVEVELHLEPAEVYALQLDGLRGHGELVLSGIVGQVAKLVLSLHEVFVHVLDCRQPHVARVHRAPDLLHEVRYLADTVLGFVDDRSSGRMPLAGIASGQTALDSLDTPHVLDEPTEAIVHMSVAHRSER